MTITNEGYYVCDYCGDDTGRFDHNTGNHPQCNELHALREGLRQALAEVEKAYPVDIFPDTTQDERDEIIKTHRGFIDRTGAMTGRHLAKVIRERAEYFAKEIAGEQDDD